ncbi:MAG: T9SS type A sorting domain-containing protein [Flavobacterium sp.]|nr:T9SS type A sorting domain-containing protein [Flavobacterium sp.]
MKTKLLLFFLLIFAFTNAQVNSVAVVGEAAGGWPGDPGNPGPTDVHQMSSVDGENWTLNGLALTNYAVAGGIKFRANNDWIINWGNAAFPSGTGTQGGANILCMAGTYDVTFNSTTGVYAFTNAVTFPSIGIIGTVLGPNGFDGPDVDMVTFDGVNYTLSTYAFQAGELKFRLDNSWDTNWGGTGFPSGVATLNGPNIQVPAGTYTLKFNMVTGAYSFEFLKIGIIGTAVSAGGFSDPDTDLTTTDGIHYILYNYQFTDGEAKFRQEDGWDVNWGSIDFPTGLGTQGGANISVTAGIYTVYFDRTTGEYNFGAPVVFSSLGVIGTAVSSNGFEGEDMDMTTQDGITYTLSNYDFMNGELKIREMNTWDTNYGAATFPNGTATPNGEINIPVTAGNYTLTFNRNTYAYSFVGTPTFPTVGIIGSAVNGWVDVQDTNLVTTDGETYTLMNYTFTNGEAKFRQDDDWAISWGNQTFPEATSSNGFNIPILAGTYNVTFTRSTGAYSFVISGGWPSVGILGTAVNADAFNGPDINMDTTNGVIYTLTDWTFTAGEAKFRLDDSWNFNYGGTTFPAGTGVLAGANITVTPGTYTVTFNRLTLAYNFAGDAFPSIGIIGDAAIDTGFNGEDVDMTTSDGINYNLDGYDFITGEAKFRQDNAWDINWGSAAFPTGFGTQNGDNIPVVGNRYNVYFNRESGNYAFNYVYMSIIGSAVNGWDVPDPDVDLGTDDGITYTIIDKTLVDGELKFRQNHKWDVNWGALDFPIGTGLQGGSNVQVTAGNYTITFNRLTGEYTFVNVDLGVGNLDAVKLTVYPNPTKNLWNFSSTNAVISSITIIDVLGKTILTQNYNANEVNVDATLLPQGMYFAKITAGENIQTIKVIKN